MSNSSEIVTPILQRLYSLESIAKDPWDEAAILYLPEGEQILLENGGADHRATLIYLHTLGLKFDVKYATNVAEMSPTGKGPMLKCGKYVVGEIEPIINFCHLKGKKLASSNARNLVNSYIVLIRRSFGDAITYLLWKEHSKLIASIYSQTFTFPLSKILFYREYFHTKSRLEHRNVWSCDKKEIHDQFKKTIDALNKKLEGTLYLFENKLTEADILLYSYLKVVRARPELASLAELLNECRNLLDFFGNMDRKYEALLKH